MTQIQLAISHQTAGRWAEAEKIYSAILKIHPNHPDVVHLLGVMAHQRGDHARAVELISSAIRTLPSACGYHNNLGAALQGLGRWREALAAYQQAVRLKPDYAEAIGNVGNMHLILGESEQAEVCFKRMFALNPNSADVHRNLAVSLQRSGKHAEAIASFRRALELSPGNVTVLVNLGKSHLALRQLNEALRCYQQALEIQPNHADAMTSLGRVLHDQNQLPHAGEAFEKAVQFDSANAVAQYNLGIFRLLHGDFARGWEGYEFRFKIPEMIQDRADLPQPAWRGQSLQGKSILVYAEQGLGDSIQFVRFLRQLQTAGARVVLQCQASLVRLFRSFKGADEIVSSEAKPPATDFRVSLLSLPVILKINEQSIPQDVPYLYADEESIARWRSRLGERSKTRVGLAWAGNPTHANDVNRSIPESKISNLLQLEGVDFISLQKQRTAGDLMPGLIDYTTELSDFADTAALISQLDLVISVDTSVAHLAGALGKPVWLLLPAVPDWRWMLHRADSPWYPTMKIFRQPDVGDWDPVLREVRAELNR